MKDRRGFTLLEIMIVIAIVGIMAVVATTNFFSWQNHYSAVGFQREFLSQFNEARTRSMATSLQHRSSDRQFCTVAVNLERWNSVDSRQWEYVPGKATQPPSSDRGARDQRRGLHSGRHGPVDLRPPL